VSTGKALVCCFLHNNLHDKSRDNATCNVAKFIYTSYSNLPSLSVRYDVNAVLASVISSLVPKLPVDTIRKFCWCNLHVSSDIRMLRFLTRRAKDNWSIDKGNSRLRSLMLWSPNSPFLSLHNVWLWTRPLHCKMSLQSCGFYDTLIIFVYNTFATIWTLLSFIFTPTGFVLVGQ